MSARGLSSIAAALALSAAVSGCGSEDPLVSDPPAKPAGDWLSNYGLFKDAAKQIPADDVIPYDVITVLYADESSKFRFIRVPAGKTITYSDKDPWTFPDGTELVKTFYFPVDARHPEAGYHLLETRILELKDGKWTAKTYVWNKEQTDALRFKVGERVDVSWIDETGKDRTFNYHVPNENQCNGCHAQHKILAPLGPRTRQLNRDNDYGKGPENQIDHLKSLGLLTGMIPAVAARPTLPDPFGKAPVGERARAYLEGNCAHCHRAGGGGGASGLDLGLEITDPLDLGICRVPSAAGPGSGGNTFDVLPGSPDKSIMIYRVESTDPQIKMPELPTSTVDKKGAALLREWIASMPPDACNVK